MQETEPDDISGTSGLNSHLLQSDCALCITQKGLPRYTNT